MSHSHGVKRRVSLVIALLVLFPSAAAWAGTPATSRASGRADASLRHVFERVDHQVKNSVVAINTVQLTTVVKTVKTSVLTTGPARHDGRAVKAGENTINTVKTTTVTTLKRTGSGVIVRASGYIVTNDHVVRGADFIKVTLCNGHAYPASVIGVDPNTDLAVIKIHAAGLSFSPLGNSARLRVGQWVCAFGAPFGLGRTMTNGIISAVHRRRVGYLAKQHPKLAGLIYENFTQSDTPINPGNSGGPLFDLHGHVIGINSAIMKTGSGGFEGVSYSIPSNLVRRVTNALIAHGKVVRAWLGIAAATVSPNRFADFAQAAGYRGSHGAWIERVEPNSPAAHAGLAAGDLLLACDGHAVNNIESLRDAVSNLKPGSHVVVRVFRRGKFVNLTAVAGTEPQTLPAALLPGRPQAAAAWFLTGAMGVTAADATPALRRQFKLPPGAAVVVTGLDPVGPAAYAGIVRGAVLTRVNGVAVSSVHKLVAALRKAPHGQAVHLLIHTAHRPAETVSVAAQSLQIPSLCF